MVTDTQAGQDVDRTYQADIEAWRADKEQSLRADDGWLTLIGLYWLKPGENTIGSDPTCDISLPAGNVPAHLGIITLEDTDARLTLDDPQTATMDGAHVEMALLRPDSAPNGPTLVQVGPITFFLIRRGDEFALRARDRENPARRAFNGRRWFAVDPSYRVSARFVPHQPIRSWTVMNSAGLLMPQDNPGYVEFELGGQRQKLEAFEGDGQLWFVFKDGTSGEQSYGGGRFLYAPMAANGETVIDFNKAYHPPCAFTPFATCPLPPRENVLVVPIEAGERN